MSESATPTQTPAQGVQVPSSPPIVPAVQPAQSEVLSNPAPAKPTAAPAVVTDEPTVESLQAELKAMKAQMEHRDLEASVMERVDPAQAKLAKAVLAGLSLGNGGVKARAAAAIKTFETEFPMLLKGAPAVPGAAGSTQTPAAATQPTTPAAQPALPQLGSPASTAPVVGRGVVNTFGQRVF